MTAFHRALDEADIALIERVKMTPSLYDPRNADFRLAYKKEHDWGQVAAFLGLTAAEARRRWTCMRDRYSRELKQMRLHPEKEEFGKNEFFKLMDFLRRFVRKRRERQRNSNTSMKYDGSWEGGSMDETKTEKSAAISDSEGIMEHDEHQPYDDTQHSYVNKIEVVSGAEAEVYPEYVEDPSETYDEYVKDYVDHRAGEATHGACQGKAHGTAIMPMVLQQTATPSSPFGVSGQHHHGNALQQPTSASHPRGKRHAQLLASLGTTSAADAFDSANETEDDFFCKTVAVYLRQLSRRHKIKAKVEMFQILEKYIELEESGNSVGAARRQLAIGSGGGAGGSSMGIS